MSTTGNVCSECLAFETLIGGAGLTNAAMKGHVDCVWALIKAGTDVNKQSKEGYTALMCAAGYGSVACVELLIEAGADVNMQNNNGTTALMSAAWSGNVKCVQLLIKAGSDVNKQEGIGMTALILAAHNGKVDCVKLLLEAGADLNTKNNKGDTALTVAILNNHADCVKVLVEAAAHPSGLSSAVCVRLMQQARDTVDKINKGNRSALRRHVNSKAPIDKTMVKIADSRAGLRVREPPLTVRKITFLMRLL